MTERLLVVNGALIGRAAMTSLVMRLFPAAHANVDAAPARTAPVRTICIAAVLAAVLGVIARLSLGEALGGLGSTAGVMTSGSAAALLLGLLFYTFSTAGTVGLVRVALNIPSQVITGCAPVRALFFGQGARLPPVLHHGDVIALLLETGLWQRHKIDEVLGLDRLGSIYCMLPPIAFGAVAHDPELHPQVRLMVWVSDPEMVQQVLMDRATFPSRGPHGLDASVKDGLLGLPSGERHQFHRRVIGSFLTPSHLETFAVTVQKETATLLAKWDRAAAAGTPVNAHYDLAVCTEEIIGVIGLGQRFGVQGIPEAENQEHRDRQFLLKRATMRTALGPLMLRLVAGSAAADREERYQRATLEKTRQHVRVAMSRPGGIPNMVSAMAEADDPVHGRFSTKEIEEEFITLRGAGHETTSNTISWALYLLAMHPEVQDRVRDEVAAEVAGVTASFPELDRLRLCRMVVFEALRLYPTIPTYPRLSVAPTTLGGFDLPKGSFVVVAQPALNRARSLWGDDAGDFRPDRFDRAGFSLNLIQSKAFGCPGNAAAGLPGHPFGFAPFGAGRRTCIGQRLAMMESVQITASVIKRFRVTLAVPGAAVPEVADLTLGPKEGLVLKLKPVGDPRTI